MVKMKSLTGERYIPLAHGRTRLKKNPDVESDVTNFFSCCLDNCFCLNVIEFGLKAGPLQPFNTTNAFDWSN
ncbi:hypothetical protein QL285_096027 [Trifolium repens]|jgi:hypothetical protein|nr:hypothetical protein QL285_096027 [Trifolium repens]